MGQRDRVSRYIGGRITVHELRFTLQPFNLFMEIFWWLIAIIFMAIGLIGTVVPVFPGTTIIFGAAVLHRLALGAERSCGLTALIALAVLTLVSYGLDAAAAYIGAKHFGTTRWGVIGGIAGGLVGLFFGLPGLFLGPVIGAIAGELVSSKKLLKAGRAGWGTILGTLAGVLAKILIGLAMVAIFVTNVPSPL